MASEARIRAVNKYDKANTVQVLLKLNKKTDADIIKELELSGNKQRFIKKAVREEIKKMMNEREEMLKNWNEEEERDDTMYLVEVYFYKHVDGLGYAEEGFDPCVCRTNDLAEAKKVFEDQKYHQRNELVKIQIERAMQVYQGNLEYEVIKEHSTLDPEIRIGNF